MITLPSLMEVLYSLIQKSQLFLQKQLSPPDQPLGPGIKSNLGVAEETLLHPGRLAMVANVRQKSQEIRRARYHIIERSRRNRYLC